MAGADRCVDGESASDGLSGAAGSRGDVSGYGHLPRGAPQTFTLTNRGDGPLTISALTTTSPIQDDEFVATHNCPTPIAAGASCTVSITFRPVTYFTTRGTLTITSDGKPRTISLSGDGILGVDLTPSATTVTVGQSVTLDWAASSPTSMAARPRVAPRATVGQGRAVSLVHAMSPPRRQAR